MNIRKLRRLAYASWLHGQNRRWYARRPEGYKDVYESAPRYLALFKQWLDSVRDELPVPLRIENRCKSNMRLSFANSRDFLQVQVGIGEIGVAAIWQGECIDLLVSLDLNVPIRDRIGHIVCQHCDPKDRPFYTTIEDFWEHENFSQFLGWVKERYAPSRWLSMYQTGGSSWANLKLEEPEPNVTCLACIALQGGAC